MPDKPDTRPDPRTVGYLTAYMHVLADQHDIPRAKFEQWLSYLMMTNPAIKQAVYMLFDTVKYHMTVAELNNAGSIHAKYFTDFEFAVLGIVASTGAAKAADELPVAHPGAVQHGV